MEELKGLKYIKNIYSVFTICLIVWGVFLVFDHGLQMVTISRICGVMLIIFGAVKLAGYFSPDLLQLAFQHDLAMGITACLLGVGMLLRPGQLMHDLITGMSIWILADALLRVQTALDAKRVGATYWWVILVIALMAAVFCAILFFSSGIELKTALVLVGLNLIIDGFLNLYLVRRTVLTIETQKAAE